MTAGDSPQCLQHSPEEGMLGLAEAAAAPTASLVPTPAAPSSSNLPVCLNGTAPLPASSQPSTLVLPAASAGAAAPASASQLLLAAARRVSQDNDAELQQAMLQVQEQAQKLQLGQHPGFDSSGGTAMSTAVAQLMPAAQQQRAQAEQSGGAAATAAATAAAAEAAATQPEAAVVVQQAPGDVAAGPALPPAAAPAAAGGLLGGASAGGGSAGGSGPSSGSSLRLPGPTVARRGFTGAMQRGVFSPAGPMRVVQGVDLPPPGCGPDAYKLFVGNIPRAYTEAELLPIFTSIGPVQELVVLRDRATQESKGSAFVWYRTGADADKAQLTFNMQLVLQQRGGPSSRPLVVRPAAPGKHSQQQGGHAVMPQQALGGGFQQLQGMQGMTGQQVYGTAQPQPSLLTVPDATGSVAVQQGSYGYAPVTLMPQSAYLQQQAQQQQQVQQQQQYLSVQPMHCQPASLYGMPMLLSVSEAAAPSPAYQLVPVQAVQPVQQQQQQQAFGAGAFDLGMGYGASAQTLTYAPVVQQQQQAGLGPVGLMPAATSQSLPAGQHAAAVLQPQTGSILLGSSGGDGSSSGGGALAPAAVASYQQSSNGQHVLTVPLRADQLSSMQTQLSSVAAMSGTSVTAEHNFACGSLALRVTASNQQQLNQAWQMIQGVLTQSQQGSLPLQVADAFL